MLPDQHHAAALDSSGAADDGLIVADMPVAVQLDELVAHQADIVESIRALVVAGELDLVPGGQMSVKLGEKAGAGGFQVRDYRAVVGLAALLGRFAVRVDVLVQLGKRFAEVSDGQVLLHESWKALAPISPLNR